MYLVLELMLLKIRLIDQKDKKLEMVPGGAFSFERYSIHDEKSGYLRTAKKLVKSQ